MGVGRGGGGSRGYPIDWGCSVYCRIGLSDVVWWRISHVVLVGSDNFYYLGRPVGWPVKDTLSYKGGGTVMRAQVFMMSGGGVGANIAPGRYGDYGVLGVVQDYIVASLIEGRNMVAVGRCFVQGGGGGVGVAGLEACEGSGRYAGVMETKREYSFGLTRLYWIVFRFGSIIRVLMGCAAPSRVIYRSGLS